MWIPFTQGYFVPSLVETGPVVLKKKMKSLRQRQRQQRQRHNGQILIIEAHFRWAKNKSTKKKKKENETIIALFLFGMWLNYITEKNITPFRIKKYICFVKNTKILILSQTLTIGFEWFSIFHSHLSSLITSIATKNGIESKKTVYHITKHNGR